jgi:hypothetical protein
MTLVRMPSKMDRLLALVAEAGETENVVIRLTNATWSGSSLQLQLTVTVFDSVHESWEIRCGDVLAYLLRNDGANRLELTDSRQMTRRCRRPTRIHLTP